MNFAIYNKFVEIAFVMCWCAVIICNNEQKIIEKCYFRLPKDASVHKDWSHGAGRPADNLPSKIENL